MLQFSVMGGLLIVYERRLSCQYFVTVNSAQWNSMMEINDLSRFSVTILVKLALKGEKTAGEGMRFVMN